MMSKPTNRRMAAPVAAVPVLWEVTCETAAGHRTVHRVWAPTEDEALDALPFDAPDVVELAPVVE